MSKDYEINWPAHPNIYNNYSKRNMNIYFSEPEYGVNEDTGIILLIPGFGGNANSNVYRKMRSKFSDDYNMVTVQCDYFGQEFMQNSQKVTFDIKKDVIEKIFTQSEIRTIFTPEFNINNFINIASQYNINVRVKEVLNESINNFNDMGILQAIDNITAVLYVIQILRDNNLEFNAKKIILYGHSHGAYLSYLCNAFAPNLFSLLIDNSAWLFPAYLKQNRYVISRLNKMTLQIEFSYLASTLILDEELLKLKTLYSRINNQCKIECYQGTTDNLISHVEKREFCSQLKNCNYTEINPKRVDGRIFKSTNHGLDADFLRFFDHVYKKIEFDMGSEIKLEPVEINTMFAKYQLDFKNGVPLLNIILK